MDSKNIFATNLNRYMNECGKTRKDISNALNVSYYTISDWCNGKKYPRMDKVEMLADYFGILKSDLIEDKKEPTVENDGLKSIGYYNLTQENQEMVAALIEKLLKSQSDS